MSEQHKEDEGVVEERSNGSAREGLDYERDSPLHHDSTEESSVIQIHDLRGPIKRESTAPPPHMVAEMSETPSRPEIAAELRAAEARTETRIEQLRGMIEARATASDHKIDLLIGQVQALSGVVAETRANTATVVAEVRADSKLTRSTVIGAAIASVIAVLGLMMTLWIAGINIQANMIAIFQAGLGVRTLPVETEAPKGPPPGMSQAPKPAASPPGK